MLVLRGTILRRVGRCLEMLVAETSLPSTSIARPALSPPEDCFKCALFSRCKSNPKRERASEGERVGTLSCHVPGAWERWLPRDKKKSLVSRRGRTVNPMMTFFVFFKRLLSLKTMTSSNPFSQQPLAMLAKGLAAR